MKCCEACGLAESQAVTDAKTLGLFEEFRCGVYSCCQVGAWADEQWLAWFEALDEDMRNAETGLGWAEQSESDTALIPVRFRRPVPWFRRA